MDTSEYVCYLPIHQVVVCKTCKYCVTPFGAARHFRIWHRQVLLAIRKLIIAYYNGLQLRFPANVSVPSSNTLIPELQIQVGKCCQVDGCRFIAGEQAWQSEPSQPGSV